MGWPTGRVLFIIFIMCPTTLAGPAPATRSSKDQYRSYGLTHEGDATRGRELFFDEQRVACGRCHRVDGDGGKVGPDLTAVGDKFGRSDLVDAVLNPSAAIAIGYSTTIVKTKSSEVYAGIIKDATDSEIALQGADDKVVRIRTADIVRRMTNDDSLMPEGLYGALTLDQFADLVAYLITLKTPATASATRNGMPAIIPELARPVRLVPSHSDEHQFEHPVWFGPAPGLPDASAVVEHESGKIWLLAKRGDQETKTLFLDAGRFQTGTRGLLGMVFHPRYAIFGAASS